MTSSSLAEASLAPRHLSPSQWPRPEPATGEQDKEVAPVQRDVHDLIGREFGGDSRPGQAGIAGLPQPVTRYCDDDGAVACDPPQARLTDRSLPPPAVWLADGDRVADRQK